MVLFRSSIDLEYNYAYKNCWISEAFTLNYDTSETVNKKGAKRIVLIAYIYNPQNSIFDDFVNLAGNFLITDNGSVCFLLIRMERQAIW